MTRPTRRGRYSCRCPDCYEQLRARLLARLRATRWACGILRKLQALPPHEWDRATLKEVRMAMIQCPKENA